MRRAGRRRLAALGAGLLGFAFAAGLQAGLPVTDGLILDLRADEAIVVDGKVAAIPDRSGLENDARGGFAPGYLADTTPSGHGAILFDGVRQYLEVAGSPHFDGRAKTIFVVFRADELGTGRIVNSAYATLDPANAGASAHYSVASAFANASGGGVFRIQNRMAGGAGVSLSTPNASVAAGSFYVGVNLWKENGDIAATVFNEAGESATSSSNGADADPRGHLWTRIGAGAGPSSSGPRDFFNGAVAAVVAFGRALSEAELAEVGEHLVRTYLQPVVPLAYWDWIAQFDLPDDQKGPMAQPAGDGISNLAKYAFGMDPTVADSRGAPSIGLRETGGERFLHASVRKNAAAIAITWAIEVSANLREWFSGPEHVEVLREDERVLEARDRVSAEEADRRFLRVKVGVEEEWGLTNSVGMEMIEMAPGSYRRGSAWRTHPGDYNEQPAHQVTISQPFRMSSLPVTNAQYEQFDPGHRARRGERGVSIEDDEAVVFVSWHEAVAFTEWLSAREGKPYRLPTEAEWEYACRAGTTGTYFTGETLPGIYYRNQVDRDWRSVSLQVGQTPPNPLGFHDMHGLVEEWCLDWYGPYVAGSQVDPVGRRDGEFKVTRGGSHNTHVRYLRSASRQGEVPEGENALIGFRVVQAAMPATAPLDPPPAPKWAQDVSQTPRDWAAGPDPELPYFEGPIPFVNIVEGSDGPLYSEHNHHPAITGLPNGDLFATWYTTHSEWSRETKKVAARLRAGASAWDEADLFFDPPGRNAHASALWWDGQETVYAYFGHSPAAEGPFIPTMKRSTDNGETWTSAKVMMPVPEPGVFPSIQRTRPAWQAFGLRDGALAVVTKSPDNIATSHDGGETWRFASRGKRGPRSNEVVEGGTGSHVPSIHPTMVELADGRLLAFTSRIAEIGGKMVQSLSADRGETWTYSASPFPALGQGNGQRAVLIRLREGPLFFASFTDHTSNVPEEEWQGMLFEDHTGGTFRGYGLFGALSFDEGETWTVRKLITPGPGTFDGGAWTGEFVTSYTRAEPRGYLNATQTPDGVVHLISSRLHYRFNLSWLAEPNEAPYVK